jgi:hypothetical protein
MVRGCELHSFGTKLKPMAGSNEHEEESSGSKKGRGFLSDWLLHEVTSLLCKFDLIKKESK